MKIAIFHNYMDNIGGAEIVTLTLARKLDVDIYTTNIDEGKIIKMGFGDTITRIKSIGKVPIKSPFKQQFSFYKFRKLNLKNKYDFYIISGDWAMSAAVNHHPNAWYAHSPLNELWEFNDFIRSEFLRPWQKPFFSLWTKLNRFLSLKYSKKVDTWICNSKNIQARIGKFYKKDAEIIYPPIDTYKYHFGECHGYWLSVNRLTKNKRLEIQLEAFTKLKDKKLIVVGSYEKGSGQFEDYKNYVLNNKPKNVDVLHWVNDTELLDLYAHCTGFITTSIKEDFGMTAIEAMASGKPVIAPKEGGYVESVGDNGILIDDINAGKIIDSINTIEQNLKNDPLFYKDKCIEAAKEFSVDRFIDNIKHSISKKN